ncbi:hypothetical protein BST83_06870 [Polaribacter filamentus]|uniref:Uncharacterized protein n=1 Tax=Polaribacter filamentus TaxID=53483 RepID=A0A2S7KW77_9FLAO|nr:hypothetical protein [Polaribacter filamentus]PQB06904.1 hypothetical protein BST83_06870 [Polaribacter filamentus]
MEKSKTDQISLDFDTPRSDFLLKHNSSMFIQDLSFSKYSIKEKFLTISLESKIQDEVVDFLSNKITTFRYRNNWGNRLNLNDAVLELLETISSKLVHNGNCIIEKIYEDGNLICLKVVRGEVIIKRKNVIQIIPANIAKEINYKTKVFIPKAKCFILEFPEEICSSKDFKYILEQMVKIDSKDPMFSIMNSSNLSKVKGYDGMKHRDKLDIILRKLTRKISWHHREQFSSRDKFSNYYSTLRALKFRKTRVIMLNHLFDFIKLIVEDSFPDTKLNIAYSKTIEDIDNIISDYEKGEFSHELHMQIIQEYL